MATYNMHKAKTHLSRLVDDAVHGEEVVIAVAGEPKVRLVPVDEAPEHVRAVKLGTLRGMITWDEAAWKEADREIEALFDESARKPFPGT